MNSRRGLDVVANMLRRLRNSATVLACAFQDVTKGPSRYGLVAKIVQHDVVIRARGFSRRADSPVAEEQQHFTSVSQ